MANYFGIGSRVNIVVALTVALATVVICNQVSASAAGPVSNCGVNEANKISNACSGWDARACCTQIVDVGSACICRSDSNVLNELENFNDLVPIELLIGAVENCDPDIQEKFACLLN